MVIIKINSRKETESPSEVIHASFATHILSKPTSPTNFSSEVIASCQYVQAATGRGRKIYYYV